eukprot:2126547-Pleurochrysis_carterae.AAC.1
MFDEVLKQRRMAELDAESSFERQEAKRRRMRERAALAVNLSHAEARRYERHRQHDARSHSD